MFNFYISMFFRSLLVLIAIQKVALGSRNTKNLIILNGTTVPASEAKYQLALFRNGHFVCGAILITHRVAFTAAHCVYGFHHDVTQFSIRYNTVNYLEGPFVSVKRISIHPAFTFKSFNYDIAIITLQKQISLQENVDIISIAKEAPVDNSSILVTGWGYTESIGPTSEYLLKANLTKISNKDCKLIWENSQPITDTMFCAKSDRQSSCKGDSGGPAVVNKTLVGLVSWGSKNCLKMPNVFLNLAHPDIKQWINVNLII